jgi:hypothetical protein
MPETVTYILMQSDKSSSDMTLDSTSQTNSKNTRKKCKSSIDTLLSMIIPNVLRIIATTKVSFIREGLKCPSGAIRSASISSPKITARKNKI